MKNTFFLMLFSLGLTITTYGQSAKEIIQKMDENAFGGRIKSSMKMTIVRPTWSRTMELKSWADGTDYSLILITAPAREKGISYLKREKEMWNFQPSIDRTIKMPPSMMMQSWMGSDFKNDDLVRQSSIVKDYTHEIIGKEEIEGRLCYKIQLIPNEDAPVVWGKVIIWVDTKNYLNLKTEHYDEDDELVDTSYGQNIKEIGGRLLPTKMVLIPADEEGHKTIMEYQSIEFDATFDARFFSTQNMKRVR
ncbi:outer membrane lipoprotein-sorting protein [Aureispira anguillae]|uniref:Outer membrane lipoprotein-sorting protein n=1 Tax=Aureispira anguillae TaxID=2864201 RepID=A0A915YIK1_9BACT|nr:outer membrane lipoprotein-sorting protein [Aureispira anguillae]BDS13829.1 outer membrane lipoprotein-sorting protein [Aureispira anguillae]